MKPCHCVFATDLHGQVDRYRKLASLVREERPEVVLLGGDLLPPELRFGGDFIAEVLRPLFEEVRRAAEGGAGSRVLLIPGNDDPGVQVQALFDGEADGLWTILHRRMVTIGSYRFAGYACVPPTPFALKDWERYDVSRYVEPGCVPPDEGWRTMPATSGEPVDRTIVEDLAKLAGEDPLERTVFLFHAPPYATVLDRAALDGVVVDRVPVDVHCGSVAIARFIEDRQPLVTLHGHIHESVRLTGAWRQRIGRTHLFGGAHDGPELACVRFDLADLDAARRDLV
jgi:Icc-related predicted phosphoesterase